MQPGIRLEVYTGCVKIFRDEKLIPYPKGYITMLCRSEDHACIETAVHISAH
jgi:hypothetical protein